MRFLPEDQVADHPRLAWLTVALAGAVAPAGGFFITHDPRAAGTIVAIGMMGAGMIAAAAAGRFAVGVGVALLAGAGLVLLARGLGLPALHDPRGVALAALIASISFAARGTLFARSAAGRGWWIALGVVAGEAAVLLTAAAMPGAWPGWVLALLPAQWASLAVQAGLTRTGAAVAGIALVALGGTAAATLLVARLWPRRWPYVIMFTTWLGVSALVWERWGTAF
ncbi:hypothetical protein [Porphyrobacter sp. AAP82]|uniref:hypothetical protein n=1 Tax=Porphyrobacter sp. AAP82 TaxID=1248917 RepID=UPI0002D77CF5|nr:hypothetical protein [Porphyrobacter sp. AAP82]